jgi:hypothetical protein
MASGTGMSSVINPVPVASTSSLLHNAHPIDTPNSMGGNTALYESKGGYFPKKITTIKKGTKRGGKSKKRRARKSRRSSKRKR